MMTSHRTGATVFWDGADPARVCSHCGHRLEPPFVLRVGRRDVVVGPFTQISEQHVTSTHPNPRILARARQHPQDPRRWGLHNMSGRPWHARQHHGRRFAVEPDETVEITHGLSIELNPGHLTVREAARAADTIAAPRSVRGTP